MQILRHYPFSILTVLAIWYLSFFTPPHTQLEEINNFDKLVHVVWRSKFHYMDRIPDSAQANQEFPTNHGKHPVSHPDERMH